MMIAGNSSAPSLPLDRTAVTGSSPSTINSMRICVVMDRLDALLRSGQQCGPVEFYNHCLSLSRGIDYALANGEIPVKAKDLPALMKQLCKRKNDEYTQGAVMVLMISVKNACKLGWFQPKETEELFSIADELGKIYCSMGNINDGPNFPHSTISTIMERFYPKLKLGQVLVSIEAKPGYGAYTVDFHITKSVIPPHEEKIMLLVAQTDNIETSACLISPQLVSFLLNGKGVDRRTNVIPDTGPQMPTCVNSMLKYGTNLLQAIGQFNGHYVILVAYTSPRSLPEHPILQDYIQPAANSVDADSDVIEGPSQISLNCPISCTRIKTPVKGHSCKHFQCFDFDNYININSRRPSWRCPHCNQYVCYADIRLDRNMVEILKDVGENIVEVIVRDNGSWGSVMENDPDKMPNKTHICAKELTEPQEPTCSPRTVSNVLDLTNDDDYMEIMETLVTTDKKPFSSSVQNPNSMPMGLNSTDVDQNVNAPTEDDFWSGLCLDSFPPFLGAEGHESNTAVHPVMHNQVSAPNNLQLQPNYMRSPIVHNINRNPVAVQALPVPGPQQNSRNNMDSLLPSSSTATNVPLSNTTTSDCFNAILSDTERQQHFSHSPKNLPQVSGVNSSVLQHHSATQIRVPPTTIPAPSQSTNPNRPAGLLSDLSNPHLQRALNPRAPPSTRPSNTSRFHIQQGGYIAQSVGATANSQQTRFNPTISVPRQSPAVVGQNQIAGTPSQSVSGPDDLFSSSLEQNLPTKRMRGSLSGRNNVPEDVMQQIIAPTQSVQNFNPQGQQPVHSSRLQGPQPGQGSRPLTPPPGQGSRPLTPPPGLGSRPLAPPPGLGSRPQVQQPFRPTGVSPHLDALFANRNNNSSNT